MSVGHNRPIGNAAGQVRDVALPQGAVVLAEFHAAAIQRELGYFRAERFVVFGYCPGGGEVIWKDGHSSGFGTGGWQIFLQDIAPAARRHATDLGDLNGAGTHVLLIDRVRDSAYAVPREAAEVFLARVNEVAPPSRPCLCALLDCASCPVRTCPRAGGPNHPGAGGHESSSELPVSQSLVGLRWASRRDP